MLQIGHPNGDDGNQMSSISEQEPVAVIPFCQYKLIRSSLNYTETAPKSISPMLDRTQIQTEADRILKVLQQTPFEDCQPLTKKFENFIKRPGIYAIKHQTQGILYIGISRNIQQRFRAGHQALVLAFLDKLEPDDVRVVMVKPLTYELSRLLSELEKIILRKAYPPYNARIPQEE